MSHTESKELNQAKKLIDEGKFDEALQFMKNFEEKGDNTLHNTISCHLLKCDILFQQGRFKKALILAEQAYRRCLELERNFQSVDAFISMAGSLVFLGKYDKALDVIKQGEDLLKNLNQNLSSDYIKREAWIALNKGRICLYAMTEDLGLEYFKRSLELGERIDFKKIMALSLKNIAWNLGTHKSELEPALEYAKQGIAIAKESNSKFAIAQCLLVLGVIYAYKGNFKISIETQRESLAIFSELDNKDRIAATFINLGEIYNEMGDLDCALDYLGKCLSLDEFTRPDYIAGALEIAIEISLYKGDPEQAKKYFQRLEQVFNKVNLRSISLSYRISKAYILKASSRFRDKVKAEKILKQLIEETIFDFNYTIKANINLCDLFLVELRVTNDQAVLDEINQFIGQLLEIAEKSHSYRIMGETYLLQAKLALISLNLKEARRLLTKGQKIAEKNGHHLLAQKISNEHDKLLKQMTIWENLKTSEASLSERMDLARLNEQIGNMIRKRAIDIPKLSDEEPVLLLIVSEGGIPIFSQSFKEDQALEDHLFGGFFTAINSFVNEKFSEGLDRAIFGEHTLMMNPISPFLMCYVFKGQSYSAQHRIQYFISKLQNDKDVWETFEKFHQTNKEVQLKDVPSLEPLIKEIFIEKSILLTP